ncbi:MAG: type II secretion system protein GspL [Planctomycetota bacterium]|nr:type II secretion system protein GspL [Planctomycetota bacterium]
MPSIIALDLGTQRIKAASIKGKAGKLKVASYHERVLPATEDRDVWLSELGNALQGLSREIRPGNSQVVVSLSAQLATLRNVTLPFTKKNEIDAVLPGQIEDQLPGSAREVALEYAVARQVGSESELLVAAVPKVDLQRIVHALSSAGFKPHTITLDIFALALAAQKSSHATAMENTLLLDLGAGATKAIFLREGRLVSARAFRLGGQSLTSAIETKLGIGAEAAETMKIETQSLTAVSSEMLREVFEHSYSRISREAKMFLASLGESGSTDCVLLTGGGSMVAGTDAILGGEGGPEVRRLPLPTGTEVPAKAGLNGHPGASLAVLVGAALPYFDSHLKTFNLLGEEQDSDSEKSIQGAVSMALILVCAILGLLCFRYYTDQENLKQRIARIEQSQSDLWKKSFPENPMLPAVRVVERFDDRIGELRSQIKGDTSAPDKQSAVFTILEVLRRVPETETFILYRMNVSPKYVTLSGETTSLKSVQIIESALNQSPVLKCKLSNADKPSEVANQMGRRIRFQFQIDVEGGPK